ncbi:cation:proton antiporter [Salinisphaera hydrothermalis]|uniref:Sodium/hydrogen exchanger n=1 Tax=Salinisphaera hydrothermalis (strain C41B8) TaxID=1304275 RepID=A0A084IKZ6_SALHC|nr:sodium:proton antiporter [Salinisphaera hydrothermalis]KEZ77380.1 sodium/hydrogen exchanger [Salinisphaera hydrothermalis C41B8]
MEHHLSLLLISIIALGVFSQWIAWWLRMPAIVLFLVSGVVAGPVLGWMHPSEDIGPVLSPIVGLAVAVILFEGGLSLRLHEFKEAASGVRRLVTLGSMLAWGLYSTAAYLVGALSLPVSLLFGAILVVTGPTVIIPMLRQAGLNRRTASYLKWEGIINDPIGALLAVLVFQYFVLSGAYPGGGAQVFFELGLAILISLALGGGVAWLLGWAFNHIWVPEYLKAPLTIACVLVIYGLASEIFAEAGLLAVTVMGMVLGNMNVAGMAELRRFKEYVTILLVSSVFIVLTADLDPKVLRHLDWHAAALVAVVLFVARPVAVFLATMFTDMEWRDRLLVGWIAPRGIVAAAVAGVFAPTLIQAGYGGAQQLLPLIFAIVFASVILHGFSLGRIARWLRLSVEPNGVLIVGASPWSTELARALSNELHVQVLLVDSSWHRLRTARLAGVRVLYGEVLSETIQQSLELNEIACMLAATSNDAYNALVCSHFSNSLEHDRVFQLPMYAADENNDSKVVARPLRGRPAFDESAQYEELWRHHFQNWQFYKTKLTENYGYDDLKRDRSPEAIPIAVLHDDKTLLLSPAAGGARPDIGDTIIYYAPKRTDEDRRRARAERAEAASIRSAAGNGASEESDKESS